LGRDRALLAFGCVCILGTLAFGTTLSLVIGRRIDRIDWAALVEVVLGIGLLSWGIVRA